jgi:VanZ family protein
LSTSESWRNPRPAPELAGLGSRIPPRSLFPAWLRAWWPALLWAAMMFVLSTDSFSSEHTSRIIEPILRWFLPAISAASLDFIHHVIRKCAHFTEYFIFFLLLYRGLRGIRRGWQLAPAVLAWFIASGYSALDEIHQSFVASRGASPWDSLLDSASALAAVVMVFLFYRLRRSTNK